MTDYIKGIDVSIIQGTIDWQAVANSGVKFCVIRCGVGNDGIDSNYAKNVSGAKAAGIKVACYHFVYPLPSDPTKPLRDPKAQAQYHFNASLGELACCDWEWPEPKDWAKWGCSAAQINQWTLDYLAEYERLSGKKMIVYTYPDFAKNVQPDPQFANYQLWIASYQASPAIPHPWTDFVLWQSGQGKLPNGVPVDLDQAKDLSLWDTPVVVAPPPEPNPAPTPVVVPPAPQPIPTPTPIIVPKTNLISIIINMITNIANLFKK